MYYITGMEVAEALGDAGQLVTGLYVGQPQQMGHLRVSVDLHRGFSGHILAGFHQTPISK